MEHIVWHNNRVTYEERCKILGQKGLVIWFTGLSGSGKSTISVELERSLTDEGKLVYLLDGDNLRHGVNAGLGFTDDDRIENVRRISEVAALFKDAGIITLVSCISPFRKMREDAKDKIGTDHFLEIYVKAELETCIRRDPKGLYKKQISNFTGIGSDYEIPEHPDLILETEQDSAQESVQRIRNVLKDRFGL